MTGISWKYDDWPSGEPYNWGTAGRGDTIYDATDWHVDLGCGTVKKGRIGIDHYVAPGVNVVMDLDLLIVQGLPTEPGADASLLEPGARTHGRLPFADDSIESIISHHCLEHIGEGFLPLVDEVFRVIKPGGIFYPITPLFPSHSAVADPDHKRNFMDGTWDSFCGHLGDENNPTGCWLDSFSVPYTKARFEKLHEAMTKPSEPDKQWTREDAREIRVALRAIK